MTVPTKVASSQPFTHAVTVTADTGSCNGLTTYTYTMEKETTPGSGVWNTIASAAAGCSGLLTWTQLTTNGQLALGQNSLRWTATPTSASYIIQATALTPDFTSGMQDYTVGSAITSTAVTARAFQVSIAITGGVPQA